MLSNFLFFRRGSKIVVGLTTRASVSVNSARQYVYAPGMDDANARQFLAWNDFSIAKTLHRLSCLQQVSYGWKKIIFNRWKSFRKQYIPIKKEMLHSHPPLTFNYNSKTKLKFCLPENHCFCYSEDLVLGIIRILS